MREETETDRVFVALIIAVCGLMGWSGGTHLVQIPGTRAITVRERWGNPGILKMLSSLPSQLPMPHDSLEGIVGFGGSPRFCQKCPKVHAGRFMFRLAVQGISKVFFRFG
jgi:hypothetical protein